MQNVLRVSVVIGALALSLSQASVANETSFPLYDHKKQCGVESSRMDPYPQEKMNQLVGCISQERDAMGFLLGKWSSLEAGLINHCLASDQNKRFDTVSYVELNNCLDIRNQNLNTLL